MSKNDFIEFQQAVIQNLDSVVKRRVKTWRHHISLSGSKRDILSPYVLSNCTYFYEVLVLNMKYCQNGCR